MAIEIPPAKRLQAARLYFEGLPYDEIARKTGIAKGSVAAIVEDMRAGRLPGFEQLSELLNELRDMALELRKVGMGAAEASLLFPMTKRLLVLGVEPSVLEGWAKMCQSIGEDDLPGSQIMQAAIKLARLEGEGLSYEEAVARLSSASDQIRELEEKLAGLKAEEGQLEQRRQELLGANQDLEAENAKLRESLDAAAVKVKEEEDRRQELGRQAKQRRETVNGLEAREGELTKKTQELEEKAGVLQKQVDDTTLALKDLEGTGFSASDLTKLRVALDQMVQKDGNEELVARFFGYLANYDSLNGLEAARETLAKEVNTLTEQRDALTKLGEKLMLTPDEVAEGIAALKGLRRKGISPQAIASYQRALAVARKDPASFEKLLAQFGDLEQVLGARWKELKKRDQELEQKSQVVEGLRREEARVKESIATLRESVVKEIKDTAASAAAEVENLCQGLHQDIARWGDVRAEIGNCQEQLKLARYFAVLPLSQEALSSLVEDIGVPVVTQYLTIALAWCRRKLNPKLRPPRAILKKYYSIAEYTEVELADVVTWALLMLVEGADDQRRA